MRANFGGMFEFLRMALIYPWSLLRPRHELALEVLALRHQIIVLKRQMRKPKPLGSVFLGDIEVNLAQVENSINDFPARDSHRLAASRIQDVLAMEIPPAAGSSREGPGIDPTHPPDVGGQPDVG